MKLLYGIDRHVPTTYLGVSPKFSANLEKIPQLPNRYFVYVGSRKGYKDSHTAIKAFARVCEKHADINLVFLGGGRISSKDSRHLKSLGILEKVSQWDVSDDDLPRAYSNATALLYPSIHEGFGLPLVEAMASGTPVIASDTTINREIAGGAGTFFPVGDSFEMADLMRTVLAEPNAQKTKIMLGLELSKKFSWFECAKQTAEVYKGLLQGSRAHRL
jgi:glycosyltransferase involved in cell wall biosynthesis